MERIIRDVPSRMERMRASQIRGRGASEGAPGHHARARIPLGRRWSTTGDAPAGARVGNRAPDLARARWARALGPPRNPSFPPVGGALMNLRLSLAVLVPFSLPDLSRANELTVGPELVRADSPPGAPFALLLSPRSGPVTSFPGVDGATLLDLSAVALLSLLTLDATGTASLALTIPPAPGLVGLCFFVQGFVPGVPAAGSLSNPILVPISS